MNKETSKHISDFLHKSNDDKVKIIVNILKKDYKHKFSDFGNYTLVNIAKETIRCIRDFSGLNESSPINVYGNDSLRVCFQPSFKDKNRFDRIVSYFAHMVTGDTKGGLRVYNPAKARAMRYITTILLYPDKIYVQNKDRNSYLFERKIAINSNKDNSHAVLYIEKMSNDILRVVTILPHVNISNTEKQKENKSIEEIDISSFVKIRNSISPSPTGDFENGGEVLFKNDSVNIQNNFTECTPEDEIILKLTENQQDNFLNPTEMSQETIEKIEKIEKLEKAINSPATPENIKETMRKALETLKSQNAEVVIETPTDKKYSNIKSCLLDDGDDSDDYIYEGKLIHNVEVLPKDTWEIVEFYKYGVVLKHVPISVLADSKPNKNVSLEELKSLFASDKIEIDGIEKGNTKLFNLCIKAIIKCIDSIDMAAYKENLLAELNASKTELEKTIEASNLLESEKNAILSEKSNLEKETSDKIKSLESDISAKSISMEEATRLKNEETAKLKKQLEDLEALNSMRTLIDMLQDDVASKISSIGTKEDLHNFLEVTEGKEPKVEQIFPKQKIKVKEIRLFAAEGKVSGYGFPKVVSTYEEANDAVMPVYEDAIESSYANKCRFKVTFEDGETYDGDLFVGEKYDNPTKGNVIGNHIKDYLERDLKNDRVSDGTKKEIREFLENYDLGFIEKIISYSIIDSDFNLLGNSKEPYLLTPEQFSNLIEEKNKILGRDYAKLKPLFEKYSIIKNGYEKIKEDVFSNPLLAYYIAHKSETSMGYADTSHLDRNKIKTENAKYLIDNIDKYASNDEFRKYIKLIYFANQKSNENHKNIVQDALRLTYKGGETSEQSKSDYKRAIDNGEVNLDDVLFILKESKIEPTSELTGFKYEKGGKLKGTWGQSFPEEGRTGMYKGASVIVTSNRAGDILFDELDEDEKVVKSDKASLSEFRSYFRPFEPRETDVIYAKGGKIEAGDEIIITTDSLGKQYEGMRGVINDRKLTNDDMYSVKLANGLEMAFNKSEFRHNSVNPRW